MPVSHLLQRFSHINVASLAALKPRLTLHLFKFRCVTSYILKKPLPHLYTTTL